MLRWWLLGAALVAAGMLVRAALYFPPAMFQIDSDGTLAGLCAFRVLQGHHPAFFPGGTRLSAASCYVAAAYFHAFGIGRLGLALTALTWALVYLVFTLLFLQSVLGIKRACVALLFAVLPSEQFLTVTYVPWGYGEIVASCAATLWLAAQWRTADKLGWRIAFGASVGFGLWISLQTLMVALPAIVWIALRRRITVPIEWAPALAAGVVGATPFLLGNVAAGFPSLTQNWASRPVANVAQAASNLVWLLISPLPKLLVHGYAGWPSIIFMAGYALLAAGFVLAVRERPRDATAAQLAGFVAAACVLFFVFSQAGSIRGWTVRYIAPFYSVVPLFCGIAISGLWPRRRALAIAAAAALLLPNPFLYALPGTAQRAELSAELQNDERLREMLARHGVNMVYGNYFWVYHLNFDTRERVAGIPSWAPADYYRYDEAIAAKPVRWAMIGGLDELHGWARGAGERGRMTTDGDLWVFVADRPAARAGDLIRRLRSLQR